MSNPTPNSSREALVRLLQSAHSGELAVGHAYRGHAASVSDPEEKVESHNVKEYEDAADHAVASGHPEFVECLLEMAEVEWDHEAYFRSKVESHWLRRMIRVWPPIPPKSGIRTDFARRNPGYVARTREPLAV